MEGGEVAWEEDDQEQAVSEGGDEADGGEQDEDVQAEGGEEGEGQEKPELNDTDGVMADDNDLRTRAWEVLDTARIILQKAGGKRSPKDDMILADVHMRLGDLHFYNELYTLCYEDYSKCLEIRRLHCPPHDRLLQPSSPWPRLAISPRGAGESCFDRLISAWQASA